MREHTRLLVFALMVAAVFTISPRELESAVTKLKTWSTGESLTAANLNSEFSNIYDNGEDLGWPATKAKDMDANAIQLDGDQDTTITADTDDQIDFAIGGADAVVFGHTSGNTGAAALFDSGAFTSTANTNIGRARVANSNALTVPAGTTSIAATLYLEEPNLVATGTITESATLYIEGAASEATTDYALIVDSGTARFDGTVQIGGTVDLNGNELIIDADADTSMTADSDDRLDIRIGGTDEVVMGLDGTNSSGAVTLDIRAMSSTANTNVSRLHVKSSNALTIPAGTTTIAAGTFLSEPNFTATGTITSAVNLYIADAPSEGGSNNYALWVDSGATQLDGTLAVEGNLTATLDISAATYSGAGVATQAEQETGTATDNVVVTGRQHFHQSAAKAWANFLVDGTLQDSYNVTSVAKDATGKWTVTWATDFADANYITVGNAESVVATSHNMLQFNTPAVGTVKIESLNGSSAASDPATGLYVAAFGDH